jgi:hypothetical protein
MQTVRSRLRTHQGDALAESDEVSSDPREDPDFISEDGVAGPPLMQPGTYSQGWLGRAAPVFVPKQSTPLDDEGDGGSIPRYALWSMKYLQRSHLFSHSEWEIRESFGRGLDTVYVMDDGRKHCLISRKVGSGSGTTFCLVAQISVSAYEQLVDGASPAGVFADAEEFHLCSVFEDVDAVSNVTVVESYRNASEVPSEYLPPHPAIVFAEPKDT